MIYMTLTVHASYSWVAWHKCHAIQGVWVMSCILHVMVSHMLHTTFEWHPNTTLVRRMCVPLPCLYFCLSFISLSSASPSLNSISFKGALLAWETHGSVRACDNEECWQRPHLIPGRSLGGQYPPRLSPPHFNTIRDCETHGQWWDSVFHSLFDIFCHFLFPKYLVTTTCQVCVFVGGCVCSCLHGL